MLAELSKPVLSALLSGIADLALLLDAEGTVLEVVVWSPEIPEGIDRQWKGRALAETLEAAETERLQSALEQVQGDTAQRLDLVHKLADGVETLPVQYQITAAGDGQLLAAGVDLRPTANLRQQLVNAQQALEQDYWRLRQVETRYRRLFDMVGDALLVLDALSLRVLEANPPANEMFGEGDKGVVGKVFPRNLDPEASRAVQELLADLRSVGRGQLHNQLLADGDTRVDISGSFLRQAGEERFLLRFASRTAAHSAGGESSGVYLPEVLRAAPDAVVLADDDGRIMAVNRSFLELAQLVAEEQVLGHSVDRWLGRTGVDLSVLLANLRDKSVVKLFSSTLVPVAGTPAQVEVSGCRLDEPDGAAFALFIRDVERRVTHEHPVASKLPSSIEQVTQRVGRVPLKELVRESTDLIEALCIETALEVTGDNRASAAELLGLSRQSLYAKLRRFNIGGGDNAEDSGRK